LLSNLLPNIETVVCADHCKDSTDGDARKPTSFNFNLTTFRNLESFYMNIETVEEFGDGSEKDYDYLLLHFNFTDDDEAFHIIHVEKEIYRLTPATQQFILDCTQNEALSTKLLTFECSKIEEFSIFYGGECSECLIGSLHFGQLNTAVPDHFTFFCRCL
jgi:hypothetical protein